MVKKREIQKYRLFGFCLVKNWPFERHNLPLPTLSLKCGHDLHDEYVNNWTLSYWLTDSIVACKQLAVSSMSSVKVRHSSDRRGLGDRERDEEKHSLLSREEEEEEPYQYWALLRSFLYALVVCVLVSCVVFSQIEAGMGTGEHVEGSIWDMNSGGNSSGGGKDGARSDLRQSVEKMVADTMQSVHKMRFKDQTSALPAASRSTSAIYSPSSSSSPAENTVTGKCASQWTPQQLTGRCYGLKPHTEFSQLKNIRKVKTSAACKDLCCRLGAACQSWQYWLDLQVCKLGGRVGLGKGAGGEEGPWCEQEPPVTAPWRGRKVMSRHPANSSSEEDGRVQWSQEILETQCFGFEAVVAPVPPATVGGDIVLKEKAWQGEECQRSCGQERRCAAWQFHAERGGCFHFRGDAGALLCEPYRGTYDGGTKMGGMLK